MDKTLAKKAARITAAAKVAGGLFVVASRDPDLHKAENTSAIIAKFKFLEHSCTDCGTKFNAPEIAGMHHNCIACGSGRTDVGAAVAKPNIPKDDKLSLVTCKTCGTNNIMPMGVVASTDTLCCTACGHSMNYKLKADADVPMDQEDQNQDLTSNDIGDDEDVDDMNLIDIQSDLDVDGPSFDDGTDANDGVTPDPAEIVTDGIAGDNLFDDPGSEPDTLESDANEMPNNDYTRPENNFKRPADVSDEAVPPEDQIQVGADDLDPDAPAPVMDVDMMDQVQDDAPELSFVYIGQSMAIASGTTIVASLKAEDAGENAEILHTAAFQTAVAHSIKTLGLKKACANYGFTSNKVKVKLVTEVAKQVKAKTEQVEAKVTAKLNDLSADFQQALDISAAGFASNFWRNKHDPVKASLITELASLGVKSAEKLVDRVFAAHGVAQSREILAMARELSVQPVEARNGLSQAINLSKYLPTKLVADADEDDSDADEDDEDEDEDDEEATVAPVAVSAKSVIANAVSHQETATYKSHDLQRILGGKPFSF